MTKRSHLLSIKKAAKRKLCDTKQKMSPIGTSKKRGAARLLLFHSLFLFSFHNSKRILDNKGNTKLDIIIKIISKKIFPMGHHPLSVGDSFIISQKKIFLKSLRKRFLGIKII